MIENAFTKLLLVVGFTLFGFGVTLTLEMMSTLVGSRSNIFFAFLGGIVLFFIALYYMLRNAKKDSFFDPAIIFLRPFFAGLLLGGLNQYRMGNIPLMKLAFLISGISFVVLLIFECCKWTNREV